VNFYCGKVLRIDLTRSVASIEPLNMEWASLYLGGKGLLFRYLWEEIPPGLDPLSPDNALILMSGPFAGTNVTTCSRLVVGCKSPVTGTILDSYVGGSFAPEMKFAGYDAIIMTGMAPQPTVVWIDDEDVEFRPAAAYAGMLTSEVEAALRRDLHKQAKVLSIGPAGESAVPWACLSTDQYHKAGRGGLGALMGLKRVKAVAVRGSGAVAVGDSRAFLADMRRLHHDYILTETNLWAHEEGTPALVDVINGGGALPTRNYSAGVFAGASNINSESFQKIRLKKRACYQCAIACRNFHGTTFNGNEVRGEGPEFETIALCGSNCCIDDIDALMEFNRLCDELGMDTISTGSVTALAMDLTERGFADLGLRFGDVDSYVKAPELIASREGVGAELALGARALAAKYGHPELGMEVKNLELPGYDPRGAFGMALEYATSDRGACHMRGFPVGQELVEGTMPPHTLVGKADWLINAEAGGQNFFALKFSGIWCDFWAIDLEQISLLMRHLWGRDVSRDELMTLGERIWNLGRLFNLREGLTAADDTVPARICEERFDEGPAAGLVIDQDTFEAALQEYYFLRGWDEAGVPTEVKLKQLGVDVRL
jgi:aldehyde:ferredoxin oxidoreductase